MINLSDNLTVVITTHVLPTAPSTQVLEECIGSIRDRFKGIEDCNFIIYCDTRPDDSRSSEYIRNIRENIPNITLIENPNSGLKVNYFNAMHKVKTPFILFSEHDWVWLRDVEVKELVSVMRDDSSINFVRFNKRNNWETHDAHDAWETHIEEAPDIKFPLMKTNCWATHPHIIRKDKFVEEWMPLVDTIEGGWSIELSMFLTYSKDIARQGFNEAQKEWGVFNYGDKTEPFIIRHLDGSNSGRE